MKVESKILGQKPQDFFAEVYDPQGRATQEVLQIEGRPPARVQGKEEERFLSAQADAFAGANAEKKIGLLRSE